MKISNGFWILREGVTAFYPQEAYFTECGKDAVRIVAPTHRINHRGDTLGGVNLTFRITAPMPGIIRIQAWHYRGAVQDAPCFTLSIDSAESGFSELSETEEEIYLRNASLELRINKREWRLSFYRDGRLLTESTARDIAYVSTEYRGDAYVRTSDRGVYLRGQLSIGVDELFYGFGEKFTAFVKNGQSIDIWNEDGGTSTELSYKNIPFCLSSRGYGVFVNHSDRVSYEVGSEMVNKLSFTVPGESLDFFLIDGPSPKDVLRRYTDLTGKPALPPQWTFGLWLSTSFTTNYDEETVMHFIDGMLERSIPLKVFHFDCFWMKEFHWTDFLWDERVFPDPSGLLSRIHAKGLRCCVWINPYIAQESALFEEGMANGYFLMRPDGGVWQWDMWQPGMAIVDFTNPAAKAWYQDKLRALVDLGVDAFKTDFGERIPVDCVYHNGLHSRKMHNYYTYLYNQAVYEVLEEKKGHGGAVLFARSATVGGQKFPVHWGGDCWSDYNGMEETLRGGLSLMLSGFGFWSHDIGGFEHTSTADVYKRWAAFGLLSSHSRLHGSSSYRVPWSYDEEAVDVVRSFTRLKLRLMPYLWTAACIAHTEGIPMMRAMLLEYPEDRMCRYLDKQYFLGESLLVAPICNPDSLASYYLPAGTWTDYFTGEAVKGGRWYERECDYLTLPLYVREDSIIATGAREDTPEYDYAEDVIFTVYALKTAAATCIYDAKCRQTAAIRAVVCDDGIQISLETKKPCRIRLVNCHAKRVEGAAYTIEGSDTILTDPSPSITLHLA